jgi:hypothetical protein
MAKLTDDVFSEANEIRDIEGWLGVGDDRAESVIA